MNSRFLPFRSVSREIVAVRTADSDLIAYLQRVQTVGQFTALFDAEFLIFFVGGRGSDREHCLTDAGYADHSALAGHMLKEFAALGRLDPEGLDVRCFPADIGDHTDMGDQGIVVIAGMAGTFMIVHH